MVYLHNGNTRKKTTSGQVDEIVIEYVYDNWNQLIQYIDTDGTSTDYTYNGNGERTAKSNNGVTTKYYWDRGYISNETTGTTFTATNYIGPQGVFARAAQNATNYMFKNGHGDVVSLVNNGTVTQTYDYDAYGNCKSSNSEDTNPFRYCGEYLDSESELIYLRNRFYDSKIGRFITEDPVQDGVNWYVYAANNPIQYIDPSGLIITCSVDDSEETLRMLKELTDDKLDFVEYLDDNGVSTGMGEIRIAKSYETYRPVGQTLITDLINSDTDVNINLGFNEEGETNITSWDDLSKITIWVDNGNTLNMGALMMDMDTGNIAWTEFDDFMVLGHEMVHAWRGINGLYLPSYDKDGEYRYGMARQEELQTTGLFYKAPGYTNPKSMHGLISENGLRLEYHKRKGNTKMKLRLEY